ncbi:hypothetical protein [Hymenobacter baengnokdamensis]|uniref:hypothetical protein n=1 Tax=Hymenobacter baengnokdamensis TaxID=2615203 RepID=UPI0012458BBE|nr:hypothetical protein [Hymenobacter baengnokdamensis]
MMPFLASAGFFEFSSTSLVAVGGTLVAALVALVGGSIRIVRKNWEFHAQTSGLLNVKRKDSDKVVTLPEHYTPHAAQELLDLLA